MRDYRMEGVRRGRFQRVGKGKGAGGEGAHHNPCDPTAVSKVWASRKHISLTPDELIR